MSEQKQRLEALIRRRPLITLEDLEAAGIHPYAAYAAAADGELSKRGPGIFAADRALRFERLDDLVGCIRTGGIVWRETAARRHGLIELRPKRLDLLVEANVTRRAAGRPVPYSLTRCRFAAPLQVGVERKKVFGHWLRTTSPARTVVDLWRANSPFAQDALNAYVRSGRSTQSLAGMLQNFPHHDLAVALETAQRSITL